MRNDIQDWIVLSHIPGIGSLRFRYLIDHFGNPGDIFKASVNELRSIKGMDERLARNLHENYDSALSKSIRDMKYIGEKKIHVIAYQDQDYPKNLLNIYGFPPLLYIRGSLSDRDFMSIGMVGSRKASTYGLITARKIAQELARYQITVISGMARGIDSASHQGALDANGRTIAVLGNGIDICYPRENQELMNRIMEKGAVISEFPLSTPPESSNFPIRNRLISGLSLGIVVVEAGEKSGALITADYALQQGKDVFAIPGNITAETSKGANRLIKQGAKLVADVDDIFEEITAFQEIGKTFCEPSVFSNEFSLTDKQKKILSILSDDPVHLDIISDKTEISVLDLPEDLLNLELQGFITQLSGKRFVKSH